MIKSRGVFEFDKKGQISFWFYVTRGRFNHRIEDRGSSISSELQRLALLDTRREFVTQRLLSQAKSMYNLSKGFLFMSSFFLMKDVVWFTWDAFSLLFGQESRRRGTFFVLPSPCLTKFEKKGSSCITWRSIISQDKRGRKSREAFLEMRIDDNKKRKPRIKGGTPSLFLIKRGSQQLSHENWRYNLCV